MGQLQTRVRGGGIADTNPIRNPIPVNNIYITPVRDFRPRRFHYSRTQKERAVRLLNMGIPCRKVAQMTGPRCSSGNPIRWRQQARRQEEARRRLDEMMHHRVAH